MMNWEPSDAAWKDACAPRSLIEARTPILIAALIAIASVLCGSALGQSTAFTYQGKLADTGTPANGNYDFEFKLFDTATVGTGSQQGSTIQRLNVTVANGVFNVSLDFGACASCFTGADRFLEIGVKQTAGSTFTPLGPRQTIGSTPYALKSLNAGSADGLSVTCVSCITSGQIGSVNGNAVTGFIPVTSLPPGSSNYVQNTTSQQAATNFNISGDGTAGGTMSANSVNAVTQFNFGGNRILAADDSFNLIAGVGAGAANTGSQNTFFGTSAGALNNTGLRNSFFGQAAGVFNTTGKHNSFFGQGAGFTNSTGDENVFLGISAGINNSTGSRNTAIGFLASLGSDNLTNATAIGWRALVAQNNSLVLGSINGVNNAVADTNVGIGTTMPTTRLHVVGDGLFTGNLTAFGTVSATSQFNIGANRILSGGGSSIYIGFGAGTTGGANSFVGSNAGESNTSGNLNSFFGGGAGDSNTTGSNNTFIGVEAHATGLNSTGDNNSLLGAFANVTNGKNNATAIGARALVTQSNSLVLGPINGINGADADTSVGIGTTAPAAPLHIVSGASGTASNPNASLIVDSSAGHFVNILGPDNGQFGIMFGKPTGGGSVAGIVFNNPSIPDGLQFRTGGSASSRLSITSAGDVGIGTGVPADKLHVLGIIRVATLGAADTTTALCRNSLSQIATCNSSSLRYKTDVTPFIDGLDIVNRLRPISFTWKQSGIRDIGFGAEQVYEVAPLFTFTNEKGEIEGVKYDRIAVLLVNAIKQQEQQIEERERLAAVQEEQIKLLTAESTELKKRLLQIKPLEEAVLNLKRIVCLDHPDAEVCR